MVAVVRELPTTGYALEVDGRLTIELGWAEQESQRIVSANLDRVERLANELLRRRELSDAAEILAIIEGRAEA
jgi:hypothetical protein